MDLTGGSIGDTGDDGELDGGDDYEAVALPDEKPAPTEEPEPDAPPESINLVEFLAEKDQKKIAQRVCDDYDADVDSGSEHMERLVRWQELCAAILRAKTWPFDRAANVNVPLLLYSVLQIHGRLYDMIIPSKGEIFHSMPSDSHPPELDRANRTELFVNNWARHDCHDFAQVYDEILYLMSLNGSSFSSYTWDEGEGRIAPECIPPQDMVVPFGAKSRSPDMRGVPRYTRIHWMTYFDLLDKGASGYFANTEDIEPVKGEGDESEYGETVNAVSGMDKAAHSTVEDDQRKILEMHIRWLKLPKDPKAHPSFDGKPHAVIAWVDADTEKLMRLVLREEDDPKDAKRFARENAAFIAFQDQMAQYAATKGIVPDPMTGQLTQMPKPVPVAEPKPARKREVTFFTHYRAFPSAGFYGLGYGDMVGPLNEAMNTILNQSIDRATINNSRGGFVSRQLRFQRGPIVMQPGQFVEIDAPPAAMKDGLQIAPAVTGDPDTINFVKMIEMWGQRTAGSGDTLSGEPIGANETAKAAVLRNDNATKQISVLASRVIAYMKNDADMIWRLLSVFLPEQDQAQVPGKDGQPTSIPISRADFIADARVYPAADPRVTSKDQRISDSDAAFAWAQGNPLMANNPQIMHALTERGLHARDMTDMIPLLAPAVPPPPPPVPQEDENAAFLQGQQPQVNPADNDDEHLAKIAAFKGSPEAQALTPEMVNGLDQHARNHIAAKMKKESANEQQQQGGGAGVPGPPGVSHGPMAPGPGQPVPHGLPQ